MCIAPITVYLGTKGALRAQLVACHECWQCREQAVSDWQGRNIAETITAKKCHAVTLTYGRDEANNVDHVRAALLTYSDVQKFLKLLRRHGFPVRYFVTGEYGGKKGRAHWHIMLYWLKDVPPGIVLDDDYFDFARYDRETGERARNHKGEPASFWEHGYAHFTEPTPHAVRYNCKYIQKDMGDALQQRQPGMSKQPPLGAAYFDVLAGRYASQFMAPQGAGPHEEWENGGLRIGGYEYTFSDVLLPNGERVKFRLRDTSLELFLAAYVRHWRHLHGDKPMPPSRLVEEFIDPGSWSVRSPRKQPFNPPPIARVPPRRPALDFIDWRDDFDKRNGNGTEQQQYAEKRYRDLEDAERWEAILGKDAPQGDGAEGSEP